AEGAGAGRKRNRPRWAYLAQTGMRCVMARRTTTVFMALAAADTVLAGMGCDRPRWLTKPLLMPALMAGTDRSSRRALAFGAAGGVAPLGGGGAAVTARAGRLFAWPAPLVAPPRPRPPRRRLRSRPALALPSLAAFGSLNAYLWPRTGKDRIAVLGYSTALLAMALTALDSGSPRAAAGGALFMLSDSLLALEKFAGIQLPAHEGVVMATYASAQALLALPRDPEPGRPGTPSLTA